MNVNHSRIANPETEDSVAATPDASSPGKRRYPALSLWGQAYGRFMYRARWGVLALWVVILLVGTPFALRAPSVLEGGGYFTITSQATQVDHLLNQRFGQPRSEVVLFQSAHTPVSDPAYQQEVQHFMEKARAFQEVTSVTPGGRGRDGSTTYVIVGFTRGSDEMEPAMPSFHTLLPAQHTLPASAYLTGLSAVYEQFSVLTEQDVERS
jgi:uncharacterized membrane protein YdfJ with MMPL/SSD domain